MENYHCKSLIPMLSYYNNVMLQRIAQGYSEAQQLKPRGSPTKGKQDQSA